MAVHSLGDRKTFCDRVNFVLTNTLCVIMQALHGCMGCMWPTSFLFLVHTLFGFVSAQTSKRRLIIQGLFEQTSFV